MRLRGEKLRGGERARIEVLRTDVYPQARELLAKLGRASLRRVRQEQVPLVAYILNIYNWERMETVSLPEFEGFDWDEGNVRKNWESHRVMQQEAEQVFFNRPLIVADDVKHSEADRRYYVLGQTDEDRALFVAFTVREERIRVISARDMSRRERKVYQG